MVKNHLKRIAMPKTWIVGRKKAKWATKPKPGAHSLLHSLPLNIILRDMIKCAKTAKEVKAILHDKDVIVDGKKRREAKMPVGLMDVISIPAIKEDYRVLLNNRGKIITVPLKKEEASIKPSKITGKSNLKKGKIQINLSDSRNILVDKDTYKVGDTLVINLPDQKIKQHIKLEAGNLVFLTGGNSIGKVGRIEEIKGNNVVFKVGEESFETLKQHAFVIGQQKPVIEIKNE